MNKKQLIERKIERLTIADFEGPIQNVIDNLNLLRAEAEAKEYVNVTIKSDYCDEYVEFWLTGDNEETDKEFEQRISRENRQKERQKENEVKKKERELKEFERLSKKYGKLG